MFGRGRRAAERVELAELRVLKDRVSPHLETLNTLNTTAAALADPNSNLNEDERGALIAEARAGGFARILAKQFERLHDGSKVKALEQIVGRETLITTLGENLQEIGNDRLARAMGEMSLGEALEILTTIAGPEATAELAKQHSLFLKPTLNQQQLREHVATYNYLPTDRWQIGTRVEFGLTLGDSPDDTEPVRKLQTLVVPAANRPALEIIRDEHPEGVGERLWHVMGEGKLILLGSETQGEKTEYFAPRLRELGKVAYTYADQSHDFPFRLKARVAYVAERSWHTGEHQVVLGKMPEAA